MMSSQSAGGIATTGALWPNEQVPREGNERPPR